MVVNVGCTKSILDNNSRCPFMDRGSCQSIEMVNKSVDKRCFTPDGLYVLPASMCSSRIIVRHGKNVDIYK